MRVVIRIRSPGRLNGIRLYAGTAPLGRFTFSVSLTNSELPYAKTCRRGLRTICRRGWSASSVELSDAPTAGQGRLAVSVRIVGKLGLEARFCPQASKFKS